MVSGPSPRYASTDAGLRLLVGTMRTLRYSRPRRIIGRVEQTRLGSTDTRQVSIQATFLRLVSIVEATIDSLGAELTSGAIARHATREIRLLSLEKELSGSSGWDARRRAFKRHHGVDLRKIDGHKKLEGAIEVRNAIAHGLGALTTKQRHSQEAPKLLARIDVTVVNGYVDLDQDHLDNLLGYSADFIRNLDGTL